MKTTMIEIRDRITYIPAFAIKMTGESKEEKNLLSRAGYSLSNPSILLCRIDTGEAHHDSYVWGQSIRTMSVAHLFIQKNFDEINSGDVVDVEYILGESDKPKCSESFQVGGVNL